jgi:hypothetical protein
VDFLLVLLVLEAAVRLAVLKMLLVLSPAGCFALAWKPTQQLGFVWFNTFLATVFAQFLQVVCLAVGLVMISTPPNQQQSISLSLIGGIAILCATLTIPFVTYRWAIQPIIAATRATVFAAGGILGML